MTQAERLVLEKGRIPARIVLDAIRVFLSKHEGEDIEGGLIEGIARKGEISPDTIYTWLGQERVQSIEFDVADRILLYTVGQWGRMPEFEEYYYGVDLSWKKCACPGCEVMIQEGRSSQGPTIRLYCSKACRTAAAKIREGVTTSRRKQYNGAPGKCRNGHDKTPENTKVRKDGRTECRVCARESARRNWHKTYSPRAQRERAAA